MTEWIATTAERMAIPHTAQWSPANQRIADLVREIGPENVPVVAVVMETESGLAHVYHRQSGSEAWEPLREDVTLGDVRAADLGAKTPHPAGLEREDGSEVEHGAGGPERI